jgi:hypothetical protein
MNWKMLKADIKGDIEFAQDIVQDYFGLSASDIEKDYEHQADAEETKIEKQIAFQEILRALLSIAVENNQVKNNPKEEGKTE